MSAPAGAEPPLGHGIADTTRNEQTRLLATGVNNVAVALIVVGVVTPVTAVSFGVSSAPPLSVGTATFVAVWLCFGGVIHWIARRILRSLKP